jgi:chaperone modulatory protein CbpM
MIPLAMVIAQFPGLPESELVGWIDRGWVRPATSAEDWLFAPIDVARVRLIMDFRREMEVPEDTMSLVLSLLDQVYVLRGQMRALAMAVGTQDAPVREALLQSMILMTRD